MKLLMDTQIFLWFIWGDPKLNQTVRDMILDANRIKYLSIVSLWEIVIKTGIGKLHITEPFPDFFRDFVDGYGFVVLPVERHHLIQLALLPLHHRDPFDRLIAAQSLSESMPLLSVDAIFDNYGVHRQW